MTDRRDPMETITVPPGEEPEVGSIPSVKVPAEAAAVTDPDFGKLSEQPGLSAASRERIEILKRITTLSDTLCGKEGSLERMRRQVANVQVQLTSLGSAFDERAGSDEINWKLIRSQVSGARSDVLALRESFDSFKSEVSDRLGALEIRVDAVERQGADRLQAIESRLDIVEDRIAEKFG